MLDGRWLLFQCKICHCLKVCFTYEGDTGLSVCSGLFFSILLGHVKANADRMHCFGGDVLKYFKCLKCF